MLVASCHCGAVKIQIPRRPRTLTDCNCSICRRYGKHCGCVTHWEAVRPGPNSRIGVNTRNFDPSQLGQVRVRLLDGADTWKFLN